MIELVSTGDAGDAIAATALQGPPNQFGDFVSGPIPGLYAPPPGSAGILCIGSPQYRYDSAPAGQLLRFDAGGASGRVVGGGPSDLPTDGSDTPVPAVAVGQSRALSLVPRRRH